MKNIPWALMMLLVACAGCSYLYDYWPAQIPKDTKDYSEQEPNTFYWPSIGRLRELREFCITKNILVQGELAYKMQTDKALYDRAITQVNINITAAEQERQFAVGTLSNPGWLLSFLLPAAGGFAGRAITKLTHYSEQELQAKVTDAVNGATTKPAAA